MYYLVSLTKKKLEVLKVAHVLERQVDKFCSLYPTAFSFMLSSANSPGSIFVFHNNAREQLEYNCPNVSF